MKILDCTFRDGGYYTDWRFPIDLVNRYLQTVTVAVEIGFRAKVFRSGPLRYCDPGYIEKLDIPDDLTVAVMVNFDEWDPELFPGDERVDMVRVAVHPEDVVQGRRASGSVIHTVLEHLKQRGYATTLNLMQVFRMSNDELGAIRFGDELDVLYFADSFGNLRFSDMLRVYNNLHHPILGFHGHNNTNRALKNSSIAAAMGVRWVDGTVRGIGRGAGNADIVSLMQQRGRLDYEWALALDDEFSALQEKCGWGHNWIYHLAARLNIHPTKVQNLLCKSPVSFPVEQEVSEFLARTRSRSLGQR